MTSTKRWSAALELTFSSLAPTASPTCSVVAVVTVPVSTLATCWADSSIGVAVNPVAVAVDEPDAVQMLSQRCRFPLTIPFMASHFRCS